MAHYTRVEHWSVIIHPCPNFNGGLGHREYYIPRVTMGVMIYPCPNLS